MTTDHDARYSVTSGWRRGCRCQGCHRAMLDAAKVTRAVQTARRGAVPTWRVSTASARRRIRELRAAGWTFERIGQAVGVAPSSIYRLTRQRRCSNLVAQAVLGLEAP